MYKVGDVNMVGANQLQWSSINFSQIHIWVGMGLVSLLTGVHWSYKVEQIFAARGQIFAAGGKYLTQRDKYLTQGWTNICCKGTSWTINWSLFHLAQTNSHLGFDDGEEEFESSQILWTIPKSCGRTNLHVGENYSDHLDEIPHQTIHLCPISILFSSVSFASKLDK